MNKYVIKGWIIAIFAFSFTIAVFIVQTRNQKIEEAKDFWTMISYPDDSGNQGMFYTLYNEKSKMLIVIDGGWEQNESRVRNAIMQYGGVVDAWFLTHYHNDHVDAFNKIWENPDGIKIKQIYTSPMDYEEYAQIAHEWDFVDSFTNFLRITDGAAELSYLHRGDLLELADIKIKVLNSYDEKVKEAGSTDIPNDASLVLKFELRGQSVLFCADCHSPVMADLLMSEYSMEELHADYVQLGHHGNNSFPLFFYDYVDPSVALFDAPEWLMVGENYTASKALEYFTEKGVQCFDYRTAPNEFEFR